MGGIICKHITILLGEGEVKKVLRREGEVLWVRFSLHWSLKCQLISRKALTRMKIDGRSLDHERPLLSLVKMLEARAKKT